jgi:hypothetical protein
VLARIRKLLAKAEDPAATAEEAETYTAKAAALVAQYGIDAALLAADDRSRDDVGDRVVAMHRPYALDKSTLLAGVAAALRCRAVRRTGHGHDGKVVSIHLFGHESDLARVELLFTSLLLQATTGMQRARPWPGESVAAFRRSWLAGFTSAVVTRLGQAEQRAAEQAQRWRADSTAGGRSVALVLADRSVAVDEAVQREYPYLRTARARSLTGSGAASGYAAGRRADLGGTRVGGAPRRLERGG